MKIKTLLMVIIATLIMIPKVFAGVPSLNIKGVNIMIPFGSTNVVYLFDLQGDTSKVGGEFDFIQYKKMTLTVGGVTEFDEDGKATQGSPLLGLDYEIPFEALGDRLRIGGFVSRDFEDGDTIAGIKSSIKLW